MKFQMDEIREVTREDRDWIKSLWNNCGAELGSFSMAWFWYWNDRKSNDYWVCIPDKGFCHYTIRKRDGMKRIAEIAVDETVRRQGVAKRLFDHVGKPMWLKTDLSNATSRAFYARMGMVEKEVVWSKNGKKQLVILEIV